MLYEIHVKAFRTGSTVFEDVDTNSYRAEKNGIKIWTHESNGITEVTVRPDTPENRILEITHRITIGLRNFDKVIVPDSGRYISQKFQLVDFWGFDKKSLINNVCIPLYIFTGQDHAANLAFGMIGQLYETRFRCLQPYIGRALSAFTRKLTLEISRGYDECPIPVEISLQNEDGAIKEYLYYRDFNEGSRSSWISILREFVQHERECLQLASSSNMLALEPYWCSWTDWHSDDVNEEVILKQVEAGVSVGIKNFIVDDGWFGPGLDSDFQTDLNIGDWEPDPVKIGDIRRLTARIRRLGGRSLIWCAPHAVGTVAKCREERYRYLCKDQKNEPIMTYNRFNVLCVRNPEARDIMADICVKLAMEYETEGAKYDLFNCIPDMQCAACDHTHDTDSMLVGLQRLLEHIWSRLMKARPEYIVELKQNYGGAILARYGSIMRAGDTPYSAEGNFIRTAYIQAYSPYSLNDYQTLTNFDKVESAAMIVIKMLSVGIPAYSMDIVSLDGRHRSMLKFYNTWYKDNISAFAEFRQPEDRDMSHWTACKDDHEIHFILNGCNEVSIGEESRISILNGSYHEVLTLRCSRPGVFMVSTYDCTGSPTRERVSMDDHVEMKVPIGGMLVLDTER